MPDGERLELGAWSLEAADLEHLLDLIESCALREVVELGAGAATVALARRLSSVGGRLTSVEHDPTWVRRVRQALAAEGLDRAARVILAPLGQHPLAMQGAVWYAEEALGELPDRIDLLVVDGPPGNLPGMERGREPALLALAGRLGHASVVVLDDAHRPGERAILERWEELTPFRFRKREGGRIAVGSAR